MIMNYPPKYLCYLKKTNKYHLICYKHYQMKKIFLHIYMVTQQILATLKLIILKILSI